MKVEQTKGWVWRENELSMKEFYKLTQQERNDYILLIEKVPAADRSSMDELLLNRFGNNKKINYFTLKEE